MLVPGSSLQYEFLEFRNINRTPVHSTTMDPGTPVLRIRVRDIDAALTRLGTVGVRVWSAGGEPVTVAPGNNTQRFAITTGLDNIYIQVVQQNPHPVRAAAVARHPGADLWTCHIGS